MLQKLENAYLAILRFAVILGAGILLVAVIVLSAGGFKLFRAGPETAGEVAPPRVQAQVLVDDIAAPAASRPGQAKGGATRTANASDPNDAAYERAGKAIADFVARHSGELMEVDRAGLVAMLKGRAEHFDDPRIAAAFASGLAESLEQALTNPAVIQVTQGPRAKPAADLVDQMIARYSREFDRQLQAATSQMKAARTKHAEERADALQSLYMAAAAFGAFLLIVFLSIFIRMERSLRHLERADKPA